MNKFMMQQAQKLQAQLVKAQEELAELTVEATSGGGAVKVVMNGQQHIQSVKISPEVVNAEDVEMLEDLILTAVKEAQAMAQKLAHTSCTIPVKVGEDEQMFGSVTATDIVESLKSQDVEIDRHVLVLEQPIKELGVYDVAVKLHPDVEASVKVWVVEE